MCNVLATGHLISLSFEIAKQGDNVLGSVRLPVCPFVCLSVCPYHILQQTRWSLDEIGGVDKMSRSESWVR